MKKRMTTYIVRSIRTNTRPYTVVFLHLTSGNRRGLKLRTAEQNNFRDSGLGWRQGITRVTKSTWTGALGKH